MPLASGARLGPYEVLGLIGAGGMGEVYKARDTRLDRTVAIKVLPAHVSADPDRRARFEREAKTISQLNHPHICTLHDVGEHDGTAFLVMEHLEGETLAERLRRGALPLPQALDCATQIADALSAAHKQGVVHRDLKPGNVMLTKTGVKLLDFGLAKLKGHGERPAAGMLVSAPTQSGPLTAEGMILGTLQYMAPEQLEGKPADARTDLFAFGTIVYEMVTGHRAFEGASAASLIGAILEHQPPPLAQRQPLTPPALDRLVRKCLAKTLDDRWDTAHDVADELRWLRESVDSRTKDLIQQKHKRATRVVIWLAAGVVLVFAGWRNLFPSSHAVSRPLYATIPLTTEQVETVGQFGTMAISPDGQLLVFKEGTALVRRALDSFATTPIDGSENALHPVFSPNGSALAFAAGGRIKRVQLSGGGSATDVAVVGQGPGLAWGEDDRIYFSPGVNAGIWRVPAAGGGQREAVTQLQEDAGESAHTYPQLLPGGRALLFTVLGPSGGSEDGRVVVEVLASRQRKTLVEKAIFGRYTDSGHLIFGRDDGTVYAVPFDLARLQAIGAPVPVLSPVRAATWGGAMFLAVARNGTVAFLAPSQRPDYVFRIVDAKGQPAGSSVPLDSLTVARVGLVHALRVAPDGERYAFVGRRSGASDVWILDARTSQTERLTFGPEEDETPVWSPDGKALAYTSQQAGATRRIVIQAVASAAEPKLVRTWPRHMHVTSWSSDGRRFTAEVSSDTSGWDVWVIPVDGGDAVAVANGRGDERSARFSPDGRWVAYVSNESGRTEVYVVSADGKGTRRQISTEGGTSPVWATGGRSLCYLQNGYLVAQEVRSGSDLTMGRVTRLLPTTAVQVDVVPGKGFVLTEPNTAPPDAPLHLIVNWFEELKAKVPVK